MTAGSTLFLAVSWASVLALTGWCYYRLLASRKKGQRL